MISTTDDMKHARAYRSVKTIKYVDKRYQNYFVKQPRPTFGAYLYDRVHRTIDCIRRARTRS